MWKKLQSLFSFQADCCIGCFADAARLFISVKFSACYSRDRQSEVIFLDITDDNTSSGDYFAEIAAQIKLYCIREGLKKPGIIFCLTQRETFQYQKAFPTMQAKELKEAVRWDTDVNVPFKEGTYRWDFICREQNEILIGTAENILLKKLESAFKDEELFLCGITIEPDKDLLHADEIHIESSVGKDKTDLSESYNADSREHGTMVASWAAGRLAQKEKYLNLLAYTGKSYRILWMRIIACGIISCVLLLGAICFFNIWKLQNIERQKKEAEYQLSLLQMDIKDISEAQNLLRDTQNRNEILLALSQKHFSWYGIFVHLGTMTVDNVWLTDFSLQQEQQVQIQGKAVDYEALAVFIKQFEEKTALFSEMPALQNASMDKNGNIDFSMLIRLKE